MTPSTVPTLGARVAFQGDMRTLGIDLAAQPARTAACLMDWKDGGASITLLNIGIDDDALIGLMNQANWIGIDAPLGWPDKMARAVSGYADRGRWPAKVDPKELRHRRTDLFIRDQLHDRYGIAKTPLSVSSDRIAACAWRCASLLTRHCRETDRELDRVSVPTPETHGQGGHVVEVYPAAALAAWGLTYQGYKRKRSADRETMEEMRSEMMSELEEHSKGWLRVTEDMREKCVASDDAFDAFVSSVVARCAAAGRTEPPPTEEREVIDREGWIHLPEGDVLADLGSAN